MTKHKKEKPLDEAEEFDKDFEEETDEPEEEEEKKEEVDEDESSIDSMRIFNEQGDTIRVYSRAEHGKDFVALAASFLDKRKAQNQELKMDTTITV